MEGGALARIIICHVKFHLVIHIEFPRLIRIIESRSVDLNILTIVFEDMC